MKQFLNLLLAKSLKILGDIKIFKYPFWLVYDPEDYQVSGEEVEEMLDVLEPGDLILRGYNRYLDGKFIPDMTGVSCVDPAKKIGKGFSHGAIYCGKNQVIHAIAEGVSKIHLLDFVQCDRIAIFRAKKGAKAAITRAKKLLKNKVTYDFKFEDDQNSLYCFELCKACYPYLNIKSFNLKKFGGLIKKENVYIAQSFVDSKDLKLVYVHNPKDGIFNQKF